MSIVTWLRTPRIRRGIAASAVFLAAGGLILFRATAGATPTYRYTTPLGHSSNSSLFSGPGLHGEVALSHTRVPAGTPTQVFAEVRMTADPAENKERAPLSMAIVLDTSGSMEGEKMEQAKDSVVRLLRDMKDDDEIALVRYADEASLLQGLTRVGDVRGSLVSQVRAIRAGGGTAIPRGLQMGLSQIAGASNARVRRIVLASDGLDSTRNEAERIAMTSFERGITVSSMGIGLDFDESYMGSVARSGRGNFAFVKDASALAGFLERELVETATTTIENATMELRLPPGVRFVRATGADATVQNGAVALRVGSMFAGDERRVLVELESRLGAGDSRGIDGSVAWTRVGGSSANASFGKLALAGTNDSDEVAKGRDGRVLANATSVSASQMQLEAAEAWAKGDTAGAQALMDKSEKALDVAAVHAPPAASASLAKQAGEYKARRPAMAKPGSAAGNVAAKKAWADDNDNLSRAKY